MRATGFWAIPISWHVRSNYSYSSSLLFNCDLMRHGWRVETPWAPLLTGKQSREALQKAQMTGRCLMDAIAFMSIVRYCWRYKFYWIWYIMNIFLQKLYVCYFYDNIYININHNVYVYYNIQKLYVCYFYDNIYINKY